MWDMLCFWGGEAHHCKLEQKKIMAYTVKFQDCTNMFFSGCSQGGKSKFVKHLMLNAMKLDGELLEHANMPVLSHSARRNSTTARVCVNKVMTDSCHQRI